MIGEGSKVFYDVGKVILIAGTGTSYMQYISGSTTVTVTVPGGVITLNGTDIDVVNNDATKITTIRSRDGGIEVNPSNFADTPEVITDASAPDRLVIINYGATPSLSQNSSTADASYISHANDVYGKINLPSLASPVDVVKANAYVTKNPEVLDNTINVGEKLLIKLTYSKPVVVSAPYPSIAFTLGVASKTALYESGSGTNELVFGYQTVAGDATTGVALIIQASSSGLTNQDKIISSDVGGNRAISTYEATGAVTVSITDTPVVQSITLPTCSPCGVGANLDFIV
jgi:hypothetical protein